MDDSLEASTEQDLFLSFHPATRKFAPEQEVNGLIGNVALGSGQACDGTQAALSHSEILAQPNSYKWMQDNPDSVIQLSVHGM